MSTPTPLQKARNVLDRAIRAYARAVLQDYTDRPNTPEARAAARIDRDRDSVLDLLTRLGPLSRRPIADALGLTLPAVDRAVLALTRARRAVVTGDVVRVRRPRARHDVCNDN
jgi:hypothetical protein